MQKKNEDKIFTDDRLITASTNSTNVFESPSQLTEGGNSGEEGIHLSNTINNVLEEYQGSAKRLRALLQTSMAVVGPFVFTVCK